MGGHTHANATFSTAMGIFSEANGENSLATGYATHADAYSSAAFGRFNIGTGDNINWIETDPLFEVGIGVDNSNRVNAFTILKNGTVSFENYTFPDADGSENQMVKTDGSGNLDWISIPDDADSNPTNELLVNFNFSGNTLNITDAGGTLNADISGVKPHTIEDNEGDTKIEFNSTDNKILFTTDRNVTAKIEPDSMHLDGNLNVGTGIGSRIYLGNTMMQSEGPTILRMDTNVRPFDDDTYDLGSSGKRWQDVWATNGVIQTSDKRLKKNISTIKYGLNEVLELQPVQYHWNKEKSDEKLHLGLIAQDLLKIIPEVVNEEGDYLGVKYAELVPVLIQAIQDQQVLIDSQRNTIANLEIQNQSNASVLNEVLNRVSNLENLNHQNSSNE